jgi:hypothetical protein
MISMVEGKLGKHFIITSYGNISVTRCTTALCDVNFERLEHEILKVLTQCFSMISFERMHIFKEQLCGGAWS